VHHLPPHRQHGAGGFQVRVSHGSPLSMTSPDGRCPRTGRYISAERFLDRPYRKYNGKLVLGHKL
jgi:hypothetical protein